MGPARPTGTTFWNSDTVSQPGHRSDTDKTQNKSTPPGSLLLPHHSPSHVPPACSSPDSCHPQSALRFYSLPCQECYKNGTIPLPDIFGVSSDVSFLILVIHVFFLFPLSVSLEVCWFFITFLITSFGIHWYFSIAQFWVSLISALISLTAFLMVVLGLFCYPSKFLWWQLWLYIWVFFSF